MAVHVAVMLDKVNFYSCIFGQFLALVYGIKPLPHRCATAAAPAAAAATKSWIHSTERWRHTHCARSPSTIMFNLSRVCVRCPPRGGKCVRGRTWWRWGLSTDSTISNSANLSPFRLNSLKTRQPPKFNLWTYLPGYTERNEYVGSTKLL